MKSPPLVTKRDLLYWILILGFAIVALITVRVESNEIFINRVNFASAVVSIILATLAIVYSYFQSVTNTNSEQRLSEASERLMNITEALEAASNALLESRAEIEKLQAAVGGIESNIGSRFQEEISVLKDFLAENVDSQTQANAAELHITEKAVAAIASSNSIYRDFLHFVW